ncbi:MAG TPA: polyphosphate kinase 2 family protein [Thermomicrobiales bacterium]|nr:polyphosphate kinase 2 family protein [Thermomicrobiales bacterium]
MSVDTYRVHPKSSISLADIDPDDTGDVATKEEGKALLKVERKRIRDLQERLFAERRQSLLVILQATDTGGKDGTIKDVFKGVNPQGCRVWPFKEPTPEELDHDFLWRYHEKTPRDGLITIFNRSHYEDVLVVRVKDLVPKAVWSRRYDAINDFERMLTANGTRILKFYLHISKEEQRKRLQARLDDPEKHWKFSVGDLDDRARWTAYQRAFEDAINCCTTAEAPWYVIPANHKWYRNLAIARIIAGTLDEMDPQFPEPEADLTSVVIPD